MKSRKRFITDLDLVRLQDLVNRVGTEPGFDEPTSHSQLAEMLDDARAVPVRDMPYNVVTMNSQIYLRDLSTNEKRVVRLVFPEDADSSPYTVSVLSPLGVRLLGSKVKSIISHECPEGKRDLKIEQLLYQPEADMNLQHRFSVSMSSQGKIENGSDIFY